MVASVRVKGKIQDNKEDYGGNGPKNCSNGEGSRVPGCLHQKHGSQYVMYPWTV